MTKLLLRGCLLLMTLNLYIVSKSQSNDSTVTIIFAGEKNKSVSKRKKKINQDNILKVAPTGVFVGQLPIIYERKLTPNISIQLSAGITMQNYIRTAFAKASQISSDGSGESNYPWAAQSSGYDYADEIYKFDRRKVEIGSMFSIQPKFYFDDDALDGSYVGFSYNSYNYKFSMPGATYSAIANNNLLFNGSSKNEFEKMTDFMIHFGHQNINNHFSIEYSTAIGLRKINGEKYGATYDLNFTME